MDLAHSLWTDTYLTYKNKVVGICAKNTDHSTLVDLDKWLATQKTVLRAFLAATSVRMFTQKATTPSEIDILSLPYPAEGTLDISANEQILAIDIVDRFREFIRLGEDSSMIKESGFDSLSEFTTVFTRQINAIYKKKPLRALDPQAWPGIICQPFVFGKGDVDWTDADSLQGKLDKLLHEQKASSLHVTRIARIYDGRFIFMLKPDRLRYWLRSIALRDADETLADLRTQGF